MWSRIKIIAVSWLVAGVLLGAGVNARAYSASDAATVINAFHAAFYTVSGTNGYFRNTQAHDGNYTYMWGQAEEIECVIDAYEWTSNAVYAGMITNLLNGFIQQNGSIWTWDGYNDDNMWAIMAFARGGRDLGLTNYCQLAKADFDAIYPRAWSTNLGGGFYWQYPNNAGKNACVNGPGAMAAYLLYQIYGDTNYLNKANSLYAWERAVLFNTNNGAIYDNIGTNGSISTWASTYNQGTFMGAANFLGQTNDAALAAKFTMLNLTSAGLLPQYGIAGNNSGFNAIFLRWLMRYLRDQHLTSMYEPWLQLNATAAYNSRRAADNLSWCQWPLPSPAGTNFYSWDCLSSYEAWLAAAPAQANSPALPARDFLGYWPLDATSGTVAADASGNGNTGTVTAATWSASGKLNGCLSFNGVSSKVPITNALTNDFSIAFWVKTSQSTGVGQWYNGIGFVDGDAPGTANDFGTGLVGGKFAFGVGNPDTTILSTRPVNDGGWHFCVATRQQMTGTMTVYVDGAWQSTGSGNKNSLTASTHLVFGAIASGGGWLNGALDDIKLYGRVLGSNEVAGLYLNYQAAIAAPANVTGLGLYGQVQLNWWETAGAGSYNVKRSLISGGPYVTLTNVTAADFTDTNVVNNRSYYYVVSALSAAGESTNSVEVATGPLAPVGWLRADGLTGLGSNAPVAVWPDASGNGNGALQNVATNQPVYIPNAMNGLPAVRFNATNSTSLWFYPPVQNDFTIIIVYQSSQNNQGTGAAFWQGAGLVNGDLSGTVNDFGMQINSLGQVVAGTGNPDTSLTTGGGYNNGRPHVASFKRTRSTGALAIYIDGVQTAASTGGTSALNAPAALFLGAVPSGGGFFTGDIAEIQIYNAALANTDRVALENALKCKYGMTGSAPTAPAGLTAAVGNRTASLNWNLTTAATGYNLWRSTNRTSGYQLVAAAVPTSSYVDTNAVAGQTNYYELSATTGCGTSANSVALAVYLPLPALGLSVIAQALTLSWPGWANDWVLNGTTNLTPPVVWVPVTNAPGSNSGLFKVSLPLEATMRFFQLSAP